MPPKNQKLWDKIKAEAKIKFKSFPSIYASYWITNQYKQRGGTFSGVKNERQGIARWTKEKWVDICTPVGKNEDNKVIYRECGRTRKNIKYPLCRPSKRITKDTPKTVYELEPKKIQGLCDKKRDKKKDIRIFFKDSLKDSSKKGTKGSKNVKKKRT
jgi:hypothetical protein